MFDFFAQALLPYYMHLIATTLFCKIIFYVQHFLSMLDFIFFCSYNGFCDNTKNKHTRELFKKKKALRKRGKKWPCLQKIISKK